ncbi:uncharacterized protein DEA37_0007271, partial [Paragonimus westermani]
PDLSVWTLTSTVHSEFLLVNQTCQIYRKHLHWWYPEPAHFRKLLVNWFGVFGKMQDFPRKPLEASDSRWSCADPDKSPCPYGDKCYRKNPRHFEEYSHPFSVDLTALQPTSSAKKSRESLSTSDTLNTYGFYLFRVQGLRYDYNPTITLKVDVPSFIDIFDVKHGYLVSSAQFNFMFDVDWLLSQYPRQFRQVVLVSIAVC